MEYKNICRTSLFRSFQAQLQYLRFPFTFSFQPLASASLTQDPSQLTQVPTNSRLVNRMKSLILTPLFASAALAGVTNRATNITDDSDAVKIWQPALHSSFQIILNAVVEIKKSIQPANVEIFDVDLWDTPEETIREMKNQGKKVICYFSAGSSEDWRNDYKDFTESDKGNCMTGWPGERWLDVRSPTVFKVMQERIKLAKRKGCDAIDPDNMGMFNVCTL